MATEEIKFEPPAQSRDEDILYTTLQGQLYEKETESRIEDLLAQLNESIVSGGGGGFTPTDAQLTAMNSGIDSTKVEQIETNTTNILSIDTALGKYLTSPYQMQTYEYGAIDGYGTLKTANNRIRTSTFLNVSGLKSVSANGNQLFLVAWTANQSYGSTLNTPGGWNGITFGNTTGQWLNSIDIAAIVAAYPTYKFMLVVKYADNGTITDINKLLSTITFTTAMSVESAIDTLFADGKPTVEIPFEMPNIVNLYKQGDAYTAILTSQYITKTNGVTAFVSPTGSHESDGATVSTPFSTLEAALSVANIENIILLEGTYSAGTNFTAGLEITTSVNIIGIGDVIIDNINGQNNPINIKKSAYIKGIHFKHGNSTCKATLTASDTVAFEDCIFSDSDDTLWSNGLAILGGNTILINCCAYNNAYDGFNYHANSSVLNYGYEINCKSYNNGSAKLSSTDGQSSNATTSHDGAHIIRVNGDYYACHGGVVADLQAYSANYGCKTGISTVTDSINFPDRMSNYWCSGGTMYLYGCDSYGSKYDTAKVNNGQIVSDKVYPSNYGA